jgi:tripartite-type tricarboxylate transporter receptor subunit TctC
LEVRRIEASILGIWLWLFIAAAGAAEAQHPYPNRPVRMITPNAPGGSSDVLARLLGQKMAEGWGQQVVVDNRPGGNGFIGGEALARAPADGYTLMVISPTHIITPLLIQAPYDPIKGFTPVTSIGSTAFLLALHPSIPANSLQQLIALAKVRPGDLNYASAGSGSPAHLANALFNMVAGISMQHIPYKGGGRALTALIGGEVHLYFAIPIATIPHVRSGRLKAIAIASETRIEALPHVPTFAESGLSAFDIKIWYGMLAPPATPRPIVDRLAVDVARHLASPDIRKRLSDQAMAPLTLDPDQFLGLMHADSAKYLRVIKGASITVD